MNMRNQSINHLSVLSVLLTALACTPLTQASLTVHSGWDLLQTYPDSSFAGSFWQGIPLGTFNFGGAIGVQGVGNTDTIIPRLADATAPSQTIPVNMAALQLETLAPTSIGGGPVGNYFVTLQSVRGGPLSSGNLTINFGPEGDPHGTWTSSLDVFFDLRFGALNGPIVMSGDDVISATDVWQIG